MNDLFFIDYEAKVMISDTVGMRPDCELAHRRLCDIIWATGEAPVDDADVLTDICRAKAHDWMRIRGELMQKGWLTENGRFTHKGCIKTLIRCRDKYAKKSAAATAGATARWGKKNVPAQCGGNAGAMRPDMRSDCQSQSQSQSHNTITGERGEIIKTLKKRLNEIYKRPEGDRWSYAEETALVQISARPNALEELEHIVTLRRSMPFDERKRFFPQMILKLINEDGWNGALDKARVQCPLPKIKPPTAQPSKPKPESEKASPAMLRESIKHLEKMNPKSPLMAKFREQLKELEK